MDDKKKNRIGWALIVTVAIPVALCWGFVQLRVAAVDYGRQVSAASTYAARVRSAPAAPVAAVGVRVTPYEREAAAEMTLTAIAVKPWPTATAIWPTATDVTPWPTVDQRATREAMWSSQDLRPSECAGLVDAGLKSKLMDITNDYYTYASGKDTGMPGTIEVLRRRMVGLDLPGCLEAGRQQVVGSMDIYLLAGAAWDRGEFESARVQYRQADQTMTFGLGMLAGAMGLGAGK